jgi:His-Xaa-Ser system radical SAM maturase HxsC
MLTLKGVPRNIIEPLFGRVSFSPVRKEERSQTIIADPDLLSKRDIKECLALIASHSEVKNWERTEIPIVCDVKGIDALSEGDIVEILPGGMINVLYQIKSRHNIIFVTSRCDCHCIMCPQPVDENESCLTELNLKLISLMSKATEELALTGGEPTVVGNDLFRLILVCRDLLPQTALLLLTNGRRFSDFEYSRFLSSLRHSNITIGIPLYGDNDFGHDIVMGSKGAFNETIRGILNLASFNNSIEIRTVILKQTYDKLLRISEFIYRNLTFTKHVAFMGLESIGRAQQNLSSLWVEPDELIPPLGEAVRYLAQRGMNTSIYNIPLCLLPRNMWRFARKSISEWKDSFDSKCSSCSVKTQCSGVFDSTIELYRQHLKPIF